METFKKYLPLIVIGIVGFILLRMFKGSGAPQLLPQTQLTQTPNPDPYAQFRLPAFQSLVEAGTAQIQAQKDIDLANIAKDITRGEQVNFANLERGRQVNEFNLTTALYDLQRTLGLRSEDTKLAQTGLQTELAKYLQTNQLDFNKFLQNSYLKELELNFQQREQDRQLQQAAINRSLPSQSGQIIGSISQALSSIFGGQGGGGNIFGTPKTFPGFGGFF